MKQLAEMWNDVGCRMRPRFEMPIAGSSGLGFRPAFLDCATMHIYVSYFSDGRAAPFHDRSKLPEKVRATAVAGFERGGFFYTRRAAARACEEWGYAA